MAAWATAIEECKLVGQSLEQGQHPLVAPWLAVCGAHIVVDEEEVGALALQCVMYSN